MASIRVGFLTASTQTLDAIFKKMVVPKPLPKDYNCQSWLRAALKELERSGLISPQRFTKAEALMTAALNQPKGDPHPNKQYIPVKSPFTGRH
jgi:hypothetical protein